jgi:histidinol dehydrogenase
MKPISFHDLRAAGAAPPSLFTRAVADLSPFCERARPIVEAVRLEGDVALQRFARQYDGVEASHMSIRAEPAEFADARRQVPQDVIAAIAHAGDNIRRFHQAQKPGEMWLKEMEPGAWAGARPRPHP